MAIDCRLKQKTELRYCKHETIENQRQKHVETQINGFFNQKLFQITFLSETFPDYFK